MENPKQYICEVGGEKHPDRVSVRNSITIENGEHNRLYADVCDRHCAEVAGILDKCFPKNKYNEQGN